MRRSGFELYRQTLHGGDEKPHEPTELYGQVAAGDGEDALSRRSAARRGSCGDAVLGF